MINVDFYSFSKRKNSTKKPTGTPHTVAVTLKEDTDLERPTLEIVDAAITAYNYCYMAYTGRYYWVTAKRSIAQNTFEIELLEDYLASHIDSVRGQSIYAAFCSYQYDEQLDDERVSPVPNARIVTNDCPFEIMKVDGSGNPSVTSLASVITDDGAFNGVDIIYAWDVAEGNYIKKLAKPAFYRDVKQAMGGGDPMDYVCEVWAVPFDVNQCHDGVVKGVLIGDDETAYEVAAFAKLEVKRHTHVIDIPQPTHNDFRFSGKYVQYHLVIPCIGVVNIPTDLVRASSNKLLNVAFGADCLTGQYVFTASVAGVNLGVFGTSLKSPLPLNKQGGAGAQMAVNGVVGAHAGAGTGLALGGGWGALGGAIVGGIGGVIKGAVEGNTLDKTSSSIGSIAASALFKSFSKPTVIMVEYDSNIDPATLTATHGRPCGKIVSVSNGYIQSAGASLSFAGTDGEIDEVNNAFDGGVYVE